METLDRLVMGGSFDPVHRGHLTMMTYVLENNVSKYLDVIPAAISPFKSHVPPAPARYRLEMVNMAVSALPSQFRDRIVVRDLELQRSPPSYTVDTLFELRDEHPGQKIGLLLGSDAVPDFPLWLRPDEILELHPVCVFLRHGDVLEMVKKDAERLRDIYGQVSPVIEMLQNPTVSCSSTDLRRLLRTNPDDRSILECVPEPVLEYIRKHGLYASSR
ncbi:MAG: nicotinate (nicotinamide) nucleotide adenylyltransferase [Spirochaetia bacterium]|nr:nicotinate (nicotinamide) nucleotide adenylyltransferase [Spirochaetia bacterium]